MFRVQFRIPTPSTRRTGVVGIPTQRKFSNAFGDRERGFESADVRKHDEELLEKLRQAEDARSKAEVRAKVAEEKAEAWSQTTPPFSSPFSTSSSSSTKQEFVSMEEYLTFRKEMIDRLRELEDDIHELKFSKYKK